MPEKTIPEPSTAAEIATFNKLAMACTRHRTEMSTVMIFKDKFCYGDPVSMRVTYSCHACGGTVTYDFKEQNQ